MTDDAEPAPAKAGTEQSSPGPVGKALVESAPTSGSRRRYLAAFGVTVAVVIIVLALLPTALVSMYHELRGQVVDHVYDLFSGTEVDVSRTFAPDTAFVNVTVTSLDEASRTATLTVSGHRVCETVCPPTTGTFFSLGNDAAQRRGLPPSAAVTVPGESGSYTFTIELPIRGTPQLYPFDNYILLLGLVISVTPPMAKRRLLPHLSGCGNASR